MRVKGNIESLLTGIIVEEVASFLDIHPGIIISVDNGIILNKIWGIIAEIVAGIIQGCFLGAIAGIATSIVTIIGVLLGVPYRIFFIVGTIANVIEETLWVL